MSVTIRQIDLEDKWCHAFGLDLLQDLLKDALIEDTLTRLGAWEQRERKLNMSTVVWLTISMGLYPRQGLSRLLTSVSSPLRTLRGESEGICTPGAFCYRRKQLPVKVFHSLFRSVARPLATQETPDAFWRGHRLMALDSTLEDVPDTCANEAFFGRATSGSSRSPFPQIRCTALVECGTHAIVDAHLSPCRVGELTGAKRLIRSVQADMLVLMDRNFRSLRVLQGIKRKGAEILVRVPGGILRSYERQLPDGSWIAILGKGRNCQDEPLTVRVIEYTISEKGLPGEGQRHRLMTTLLDPELAPAEELVALYKERWSVETTFAEVDEHQQIIQRPLRSTTPLGILQEVYAILLGHFLVRQLMHQAAVLGGENPIAPDQLSYRQSVSLIQTTLTDAAWLSPQLVPVLKQRLLQDLRRTRLPQRKKTVRSYPRVVKRVYCKFPPKRAHHLGIARSDLTWQSIFSLFK